MISHTVPKPSLYRTAYRRNVKQSVFCLKINNHLSSKTDTDQIITKLNGEFMQLYQWSISITLHQSNQFIAFPSI
jgi:hypothetical protein